MKFTATSVLAGLAATAAADSWESWSATDPVTTSGAVTVCPSEVTSTVTKTKTVAEVTSEVYATTITVDSPDTKTVTVYADGKTAQGAWEEWKSPSSSEAGAVTVLPAGCVPRVVTTTTTKSVKQANSTTTITKSTLFVGDGKGPKTTVTVTATGSSSAWGHGSGSGSTTASWGSGSGSGSGNGAAKASSDKIVATGSDAFKWTVAPAAPIKSAPQAPVYTQKPDGSWGADGSDSWVGWNGPPKSSSSGSSSSGASSSGTGSGSSTDSGKYTTISTISIGTATAPYTTTLATASGSSSGTVEIILPGSSSGSYIIVTVPYTGTGSISGPTTTTVAQPTGTTPGTVQVITPATYTTLTQVATGTATGTVTTTAALPVGTAPGTVIVITPGTYTTLTQVGDGTVTSTITTTATLPVGTTPGTVIVITPGSGSGSGSIGSGSGGFGNVTFNGTIPLPGTAASNVTAPFKPLKEVGCNDASDRSKWCKGQDIKSDYYENFYSGGLCTYDFVITNTTLDFDGTSVLALAINGQVPGPTVECNWGDIVSVTVHNQLQDNGTAIHWHGVRQLGSNDMDGVPGVTECPLAPGESRTYKWHASSYGTSWYHSHWAAQYGDGVYGPIVIHGPATANYDVDAGVVAISDTFPVTAAQWNSVIAHLGPEGTTNYLLNGHNTKPDLSAGQHSLWKVQQGKKYLFRFLNAAAQNMYSVGVDNHKMTVVAADFVPIVPYTTEWLNIGIGQRYDVVIDMDQAVDSYFLRAVTQTQCPSTCNNTGLVQANGIIAYEGVQELPYLLPTSTVNGNVTIDNFNICDDEPLASLVPVVSKTAGDVNLFQAQASTLPAGGVNTVTTDDDGVVFRWFINNGFIDMDYTQPTLKTLANKQNISLVSNAVTLPDANVWVYFIIQNQFFASHPMHLHGHDFAILGQGPGVFDSSLVNTLNFVNPMRRDTAMLKGALNPFAGVPGYTVIGFLTDNPGAWLMHCHIVWHVDGGLALEFLERPDDITSDEYVNSSFNDYCDSYDTYQSSNPRFVRPSSESGLKRRSTFFDEQVAKLNMGQFDNVVRRASSPEKRYLDSHALKRGIGHSRHFRR